MKKLNAKEVLVPTVSLFLICLVVTTLLAGTNAMTKQTIAQQKVQTEESSRRVVLPEAATFKEAAADGTVYYIGADAAGKEVGYVFSTESKGYGGTIKVMTGIGADSKVKGVVLLSQNETPGLGANAANDSFKSQYLQAVPADGFTVVKTAPADGEIAAMTGATISSKAVTNAVNAAVAVFQTVNKGGSK